ncbi:MAG: YciI family protein [Anaerolineaceae bacterium]|nr:YciI family protein [Anaerolineaceae bacterium]
MKYLLMLYADEVAGSKVSEKDIQYYMGQFDAWSAAMEKAGVHNTFQGLHPTSAATTVRAPKGIKVVTHGPFAETKEQLGGFYLIDAKNLDEAIDWAAKCPGAQWGSVEIRPVWEAPG